MNLEEINKMKVVELRAELTARGLDTRGVKAILVDRLLLALATENSVVGNGSGGAPPPSGPIKGNVDEIGHGQGQGTPSPAGSPNAKRATRGATPSNSDAPGGGFPVPAVVTQLQSQVNSGQLRNQNQASANSTPAPAQFHGGLPPQMVAQDLSATGSLAQSTPAQGNEHAVKAGSPTPTPVIAAQQTPVSPTKPAVMHTSPVRGSPAPAGAGSPLGGTKSFPSPGRSPSPTKSTVPAPSLVRPPSPVKSPVQGGVAGAPGIKPIITSPPIKSPPQGFGAVTQAQAIKPATTTPVPAVVENKIANESGPGPVPITPETPADKVVEDSEVPKVDSEVSSDQKTDESESNVETQGTTDEIKEESEELSNSQMDVSEDTEEQTKKDTVEDMEQEAGAEGGEGTKRKLEDSTQETEPKKTKFEVTAPRPKPENEPEFEDLGVVLDWYKSDLNLRINKSDFLMGEPVVFEDFPWAYAGAKATYGFTAGKLYFEVKWHGSPDVRSSLGGKEVKRLIRVGWSDVLTDMQLGEEKFSIGYDSEGKVYNGGEVKEGFEKFERGDVVGAYLNLENDPVEFTFSKNGTTVGEPVVVTKADIEGKIWFPHILARNASFVANFGTKDPAHPVNEGFEFVGKVESGETKVRGPKKPESRDNCEFIMLCGLACCGKTAWAKKFKEENIDKHYNILGTSTVAERAVKKSSLAEPGEKAFEKFLMRAGRFVEKLVDIAPQRRRNYILDQSNALAAVQRRKAGGFEGFIRRAVVILPSDEEYQNRLKAREQESGKGVPKSTLLDMKASFHLPEESELFTDIEYPELSKEEAVELVKKYQKEGLDAGYSQTRRANPISRYRGSRPRGGGGPRGGPSGFYRGGAPRGGGWRGGPPARPPPRIYRAPPPGHIPPLARVPRDFGFRGGFRGRGGPPTRGPPRGIPPMAVARRPMDYPRGARGGGSWVRGGGGGGGGFSNGVPPARPFRGRGGPISRGGPSQGSGSGWGSYSSSQGQGRFGGAPQNAVSRQGSMGGGGGGFQQGWTQGGNAWARSGSAGGAGGGGSSQYIDPWAQQVPDQGFGQSWDTSAAGMGGTSGGRGGGANVWQSYGGGGGGGYGYGGRN